LASASVLTRPSSQELLDVLAAQQINDALPSGLPAGLRIAHKSGWVEGVSHDAGVVYPFDAEPFVLVVCTTSDLDHNAATALIARVATAAWYDHGRAS
jgi:beta-lactamase class A